MNIAAINQFSLFAESKPTVSGVMAHRGYPLQMGWLEKALTLIDQSNTNKLLTPSTDKETEMTIIKLGVGNSMIPSLRYWSHAAGLVEVVNGIERPTKLARALTEVDPYFEEMTSLWLIHWKISSQNEVSVHSWFFNRFFQRRFCKNDLVDAFYRYAYEQKLRISKSQIDRDVDCFLKNYSYPSGQQQDDPLHLVILRELGLIHCSGKKTDSIYVADDSQRDSLPTAVFAFALIEFWRKCFPNQNTMPFSALLTNHGSPGLTFRLSQNALCEKIESAVLMLSNKLCWSDTQGLRQLQCTEIEYLYDCRYQLLGQ